MSRNNKDAKKPVIPINCPRSFLFSPRFRGQIRLPRSLASLLQQNAEVPLPSAVTVTGASYFDDSEQISPSILFEEDTATEDSRISEVGNSVINLTGAGLESGPVEAEDEARTLVDSDSTSNSSGSLVIQGISVELGTDEESWLVDHNNTSVQSQALPLITERSENIGSLDTYIPIISEESEQEIQSLEPSTMTTGVEEVSSSGRFPTSLAPKAMQPYKFYGTPEEDAVEWLSRYEEISNFNG